MYIFRVTGLDLPNKITLFVQKHTIFLYPWKFKEKISKLSLYINKFNNLKSGEGFLYEFSDLGFDKGNHAHFFMELDENPGENILDSILCSLEFFFATKLRIDSIYYFNENKNLQIQFFPPRQDVNYLEKSIFGFPLIAFTYPITNEIEFLSTFLNSFLQILTENNDFYKFINEFQNAISEIDINVKCGYLWNVLEHLAFYYASKKGYNILLDPYMYSKFKKKIGQMIEESFKNNNINFPYSHNIIQNITSRILDDESNHLILSKSTRKVLTKEIETFYFKLNKKYNCFYQGFDIKKNANKIINSIDKYPPIKEIISISYFELIGKSLEPEQERIIKKFYEIRNSIFHQGEDIRNWTEKKKKEIMLLIKKFQKIISEFLLQLLNISKFFTWNNIDEYFQLKIKYMKEIYEISDYELYLLRLNSILNEKLLENRILNTFEHEIRDLIFNTVHAGLSLDNKISFQIKIDENFRGIIYRGENLHDNIPNIINCYPQELFFIVDEIQMKFKANFLLAQTKKLGFFHSDCKVIILKIEFVETIIEKS